MRPLSFGIFETCSLWCLIEIFMLRGVSVVYRILTRVDCEHKSCGRVFLLYFPLQQSVETVCFFWIVYTLQKYIRNNK
jgi:hypothetical protein